MGADQVAATAIYESLKANGWTATMNIGLLIAAIWVARKIVAIARLGWAYVQPKAELFFNKHIELVDELKACNQNQVKCNEKQLACNEQQAEQIETIHEKLDQHGKKLDAIHEAVVKKP